MKGEDFARAAVRECQEEAGVLVELTGVRNLEVPVSGVLVSWWLSLRLL